MRTMLALVPAVVVTAAVAWPTALRRSPGRRELILLGAALLVVLVASGSIGAVYRLVLHSIRWLLPATAVAAVALLGRDDARGPAAALRRARLVLLLSVTAVSTLVQFPFTVAIYFCYVAPLVLLTVAALLAYLDRPVPAWLPGVPLAFCGAFALLWMNTSPLNDMDASHEPYPEVRPMRLERAGLLAPLWQAGVYEATVDVVREHARGEYIWASPDVPQVYFLSGYRNPTRSLFEFFEDSTGRSTRVLQALEEHHVNVIVLNTSPQFSPRISLPFFRQLAKRYPNSILVGPNLIKWRD
jgi:hypothetical protein